MDCCCNVLNLANNFHNISALLFSYSDYPRHSIIGFSWQSLLPLLISKAAELMQIPASAGVEGVSVVQSNEFPHAFPAQYARILLVQSAQQNGADTRAMALKKLAKLLHFVTSAYLKDDAGKFFLLFASVLLLGDRSGNVFHAL